MLNIIDYLPDGLLEVAAKDLHTILPGPTLIHLEGRRSQRLFVSVLLHGNEITGLRAIQAVLAKYQNQSLPRSLSIFIGNVSAARQGMRRLEGQPDYNRCWRPGPTPEHAMMCQLVEEMSSRELFASIDLHNNTGANPHYACLNHLNHPFQQLARLFSRTVVYFTQPEGVQSMALAPYCPAVTLECGQPGEPHGTAHAIEYIDSCLHLQQIPEHPIAPHDIDLFHSLATIKVPERFSFCFGTGDCDIRFIDDLDEYNFSELPAGTLIGYCKPDAGVRFDVLDETGLEIGDRYFRYTEGEIRTKLPLMPSMLTLDSRIIRQDCLCYLMERMS